MTVLGWLVALCLFADVLFPPCLAFYALISWRGRWRIAAAAPLLVAVPAAVSFWSVWRNRAVAAPASIVFYVLLALILSAYSVMVLVLYLRRDPPPA
ncbi:MAG: hypothetical protein ABSE42_11195 [Bryobacteraceae bacterium]|jgi:hypothetical protein